MLDNLLVAVDHSDVSRRVLAAAQDLALLSSGKVWVLHLREKEAMPRGRFMPTESDLEAKSMVEDAARALAKTGVKAHAEVRNTIFGYAAKEIVAAARDHDAGVIIMGSRGRGDVAGLALGSTAHKVIHLTDRPVLVVR